MEICQFNNTFICIGFGYVVALHGFADLATAFASSCACSDFNQDVDQLYKW